MRTASFSSLKPKIGATGPKVSSRATSMSGFTCVITVGSKNLPPSACRLPPSAPVPGPPPAISLLAALGDRIREVLFDFGYRARIDQGALVGRALESVAHAE